MNSKESKKKTPEEKFNHNFKIASYSHSKRIVSIIKKILDEIPIERKKNLSINEIFRRCGEALFNIELKISDEEIEKLFREEIKKLLEECNKSEKES